MLIVSRGSCSVFVKDKEFEGKESAYVGKIEAGEVFGEVALLYQCKRTATVISNNYC